jgi:hypothetical protein
MPRGRPRRNKQAQEQQASRSFADAFAEDAMPNHIRQLAALNLENHSTHLVVRPEREEAASAAAVENSPTAENANENTNNDENNETNENTNDNNHNNEITLSLIRDQIVSKRTYRSYLGDLQHLLSWIERNRNSWLTDYGRTKLAEIATRLEDESVRKFRARKLTQLKTLLREGYEKNVVHLDAIKPSCYVDYVLTLTGKGNSRYLSKSAYGNKRSSLFHLFRVQNRSGFPESFHVELTNLFKGLYRTIAQHQYTVVHIPVEGEEDNDNSNKEGKEPMSVELYKLLCESFLEYGTVNGVFAYCYLVLTWNLSCRASNTAGIRFSDISWSTSFDSFAISFGHSKTDQLGDEAKYLRHMYANPNLPLICPVLSLSMYLTSCFSTVQSKDDYLFPGSEQSIRFGKLLVNVLKKKDIVNQLGFSLSNLGTHSIRKGAVSYLSSLPGGPPVAAICIRAGWTMGKVKDVYMRYVTSGDQFVGRCLAMLPILRMEFASSPPHFIKGEEEEEAWVEDLRCLQFPMVRMIVTFGRLTKMCLALMLFHRDWLSSTLKTNHVFLVTSHCNRTVEVLNKINNNNILKVTYPWNDDQAFSGIPPHVSLLQEVTVIKDKQSQLVADFIGEMKVTLEQMGVDGGRRSEQNLIRILNNFEERFIGKMGVTGNTAANVSEQRESTRVENGRSYTVHFYSAAFKRVPSDWRWPRCGVFDLWRQWWIGDSVRQIPPLHQLTIYDVKHLDSVPIGTEEEYGRKGKNKEKRRPARKMLCDLRYLMAHVKQKVEAKGALEELITIESVDRMYSAVADCFSINSRDAQKQWLTVVYDLRSSTKKTMTP